MPFSLATKKDLNKLSTNSSNGLLYGQSVGQFLQNAGTTSTPFSGILLLRTTSKCSQKRAVSMTINLIFLTINGFLGPKSLKGLKSVGMLLSIISSSLPSKIPKLTLSLRLY